MPNLDGTEKLKHNPYDALDAQVHASDPKGHYDDAGNWIPDSEFPKAVDTAPVSDDRAEPVVVESSAEERDFLRKKIDSLEAANSFLQGKIQALAATAKDAADKAAELEGAAN